jgi:hypothetical protein
MHSRRPADLPIGIAANSGTFVFMGYGTGTAEEE